MKSAQTTIEKHILQICKKLMDEILVEFCDLPYNSHGVLKIFYFGGMDMKSRKTCGNMLSDIRKRAKRRIAWKILIPVIAALCAVFTATVACSVYMADKITRTGGQSRNGRTCAKKCRYFSRRI